MACCGRLEGAYFSIIQAHAISGCYAIMMSLVHKLMSAKTHADSSLFLFKRHMTSFLRTHVLMPTFVHIAMHDLILHAGSYAALRQRQACSLSQSPSHLPAHFAFHGGPVHFNLRKRQA